MTQPTKPFDVQHAIISMLAVKFLELNGGHFTLTQEELKQMLANKTVTLELVDPTQPLSTDVECKVMTLEAAAALLGKRVVDRSKKRDA